MHCYASHLGDCEGGISREHYLSKSVLELVGNKIRVAGFPWQAVDHASEIGINSFTSKILCKRHNQQLSYLDETGKKFLQGLKACFDSANKEGEFSDETISVSGDELELWLLKVLCGIITVSRTAVIPETWIEFLFQIRSLPKDTGMHIFGETGPAIWYFNLMRVISVQNKDGGIAGAKFGVGGLALLLAFGKPNFEEIEITSIYRPEGILFQKGSNTKRFNFEWKEYTAKGRCVLDLSSTSHHQSFSGRPIVLPDRLRRKSE